jgi:hypothetical protein
MKKLIVLGLFGLLVVALGTTAYAQKLDFKASGNIWVYSVLERFESQSSTQNQGIFQTVPTVLQPNGPQFNKNSSWMSERMRLKFDAVMGKSLSGTVFFEMDSGTWGDADGTRNSMGYWSADRAGVEIKNLYIDFGIPVIPGFPYPVTVRAGVQPFGPRGYIMGAVDAAGVTVGINADPVMIIPMWAKGWEGNIQSADDVDLYGLEANVKVSTFKIGAFGLYMNANTYPFAGGGQTVGKNSLNAYMWWFGAYADGKAGPVDINFDFIYDNGKVEDRVAPFARDVKYEGWMTRAKVDLPWEKFNFGAVGMYGSGADLNKTDRLGRSGNTVAQLNTAKLANKVESFVNMPSGETGSLGDMEVLGPGFVSGATSVAGVNYANTTGAFGRGSAGGIWYAKLYGAYKATPWYKITLQGLYIGDNTDNGNTFGTARTGKGLGQRYRDDSDIGWELDMINEIEIYKNLVYRISGGVIFAGDALDMYDSVRGTNRSLKNPWGIHSTLTYTF